MFFNFIFMVFYSKIFQPWFLCFFFCIWNKSVLGLLPINWWLIYMLSHSPQWTLISWEMGLIGSLGHILILSPSCSVQNCLRNIIGVTRITRINFPIWMMIGFLRKSSRVKIWMLKFFFWITWIRTLFMEVKFIFLSIPSAGFFS